MPPKKRASEVKEAGSFNPPPRKASIKDAAKKPDELVDAKADSATDAKDNPVRRKSSMKKRLSGEADRRKSTRKSATFSELLDEREIQGRTSFERRRSSLKGLKGVDEGSDKDDDGEDAEKEDEEEVYKMFGTNLTKKQVDQYKESFALFDRDGGGSITVDELYIVVNSLGGAGMTKSELKKIFDEVDDDGSGEMEFKEFLQLMSSKKLEARGVSVSPEIILEYKSVFKVFDQDDCGSITNEDLYAIMKCVDKDIEQEAMDEIIADCDEDGNGQIEFPEFMAIVSSKKLKKFGSTAKIKKIPEYKQAFSVFDEDGSGSITVDELFAVVENMGSTLTREEVKKMMDEVDDDQSGEIEFPEFLQLMCTEKLESLGVDLSSDKINEYRLAFSLFDKDGGGSITAEEMWEVLHSLGKPFTKEEVEAMFAEVDADGSGEIEFPEFLKIMASRGLKAIGLDLSTARIAEFKEAFALLDEDGSGTISSEELYMMMKQLGQNPTEEEMDAMIAEVDDDGSGEIEFPEFLKLMIMKFNERPQEEELKDAFMVFADEETEKLPLDYALYLLRQFVVGHLQESATDEELEELIYEVVQEAEEQRGEEANEEEEEIEELTFDQFVKLLDKYGEFSWRQTPFAMAKAAEEAGT